MRRKTAYLSKKNAMKKLISVVMAVLICAVSFASFDKEEKITIPLKRDLLDDNASTGREREMFSSACAILDYVGQVISIELRECGDGAIYIVDEEGIDIDSIVVSDSEFRVFMNIPNVRGQYSIVILCDNYRASGIFRLM